MLDNFQYFVAAARERDAFGKFLCLGLAGAAASAWLFCIVRRQPLGLPRLLLSLPLLTFFVLAPLLFTYPDNVCTIAVLSFNFTWLATFKTLGLCCNRGPLANKTLNLVQFTATALLPITPQLRPEAKKDGSTGRLLEAAGDSGQLLLRFCTKCVLLRLVVYLLTSVSLLPVARTFLYGSGLYTFLGVMMDGPGTLLTSMIGLNISPHFDCPYLSHTVADFWGKRWNLCAGNTLRFLIYEPIVEGRIIKVPGESRSLIQPAIWRAVGVASCFVVSGLVHEMVWWNLLKQSTGWKWFAFFSMQGPVVLVETIIRAKARRAGYPIPKWMSFITTWIFIIATGHYLFIPPCVDQHVADHVVANVGDSYKQWHHIVSQLTDALITVYTHRIAP